MDWSWRSQLTFLPSIYPSFVSLTRQRSGDHTLSLSCLHPPPPIQQHTSQLFKAHVGQLSCVCVGVCLSILTGGHSLQIYTYNPKVQPVQGQQLILLREIVPIPKKSYRSPEIAVNLQVGSWPHQGLSYRTFLIRRGLSGGL